MKPFAKYSWGVLAYSILVILWGAFVRATGSGAGCGSHWPTCNGEIIPRSPQQETLIEFTHRLSSGLALILVVVMLVWAYRQYEKGHMVRLGASAAMFFMVTEALVGAALVLFQWVADDASLGRVISISVHLVNTFLLLASLTLTAWWASGGKRLQIVNRRLLVGGFVIGFIGVLLIGVSGAITALGDTLFPAGSLAEGIAQDFSPTVHFLIRLRVYHPMIAILTSFYLIFVVLWQYNSSQERNIRLPALILGSLLLLQLGIGLLNVLLLAPVFMQIIHLLVADLIWITLVLLFAASIQTLQPSREIG